MVSLGNTFEPITRDQSVKGGGMRDDEEISAARKIQRQEVGVRSGKAIVQGVRKNDSGGGGLDRPILALLMLVTFRRYARLEGK